MCRWTLPAFSDNDLSLAGSDDGGDDGVRTHDPLRARQVLSQLSYAPEGLKR